MTSKAPNASRRRALAVGTGVVLLLLTSSASHGMAAFLGSSAVPAKLVGCWQRNVTAADFRRAGAPAGFPTGVWSIAIKKGGGLATFTPRTSCRGSADFTTSIAVTGGRLTIRAVPVCPTKGVYGWSVSGTRLTLRAFADKACSPRRGLYAGVWKRR
jgi:hypothetical protein